MYMQKNPFVIIGDIPEEYFCDRKDETAHIIRTISNEGNLVLMSPRRMGKSKLVRHVFRQSEIVEDYYTFYIDLLHTSGIRDFTYTFGRAVFDQLKSRSEKMLLSLVTTLKSLNGTFGFDPVSSMPTFTLEMGKIQSPEFTLSEIFSWLENCDKPCVVCFDEFQKISKYPENNDGAVEALIRGHIQHLSNAHFIFAGSEHHILSEMFSSQAKPFYNSSVQYSLKPIKLDVYSTFASSWMERYDKYLDTEALSYYYGLFDGTTYLLQKLMHEAFIEISAGETCDRAVLDKCYDNMLEEVAENYNNVLGSLTERQKDALFAIAREGNAERIMSGSFIKRHALASASAMQSAVKKLLESELITVKGGIYSLSDILFRLYIVDKC